MAVVVVVVAFASAAPVVADNAIPAPCAPHGTHIANPGCVPALTSDVREPGNTLPNVSPDVRVVQVQRRPILDEESKTFREGPPELAFDGWVQNLGGVPLELMADDPSMPTTVHQCVSWTAHVCRKEREVGTYAWHEEHRHFHFQDFAQYELRTVGPDGWPDYSSAGLLALSEKVSFCLVDASLIDLFEPAPPFYFSCGPSLQGVSPGWADVYAVGTPGQTLPLDGLGDGRYALVVSMNVGDRLYETDYSDNVVEVIIELSGDLTTATIVDKRHPDSTGSEP